MSATARARSRPEAGELVSLAERAGSLGALRLGFAAVVIAFGLLVPERLAASTAELLLASTGYLVLLLAPWVIWRRQSRGAIWILGGTLLADGVYLAWAAYATGGTQSPLRFLLFVHVVAVTLLASYRTGLKVAAWHSLLFFVVLYAQAAELVPVRETLAAALPGGADFWLESVLGVGALWVVALGTAACSSVNERELRAQKVDLEELSDTVSEMDHRTVAAEIPGIVLEALCRVFGFPRGVVLASPEGELTLLAGHGIDDPSLDVQPGQDRLVERAWDERRTQLVHELDAESDPRLAALLPDARNVLVVPLLIDRGFRIGVIALEQTNRRDDIKRWVVTVVEQFASHAALTLQNAWLLDQLERRLAENRALQQQLMAQNLDLELKVQERTADLTETLSDLQAANEQRRLLLVRLVHAEEEERQRIAADIHDDPVQKMVGASMWLQLLRRELSDPMQLESLDKLLSAIRGTIESLRHMIFELRPHALDEHGLGPALEEYLDSLEADFEYRVEDQLADQPPAELRVILYRMAQEALANARKHSDAERVDVLLTEQEGGFFIRIIDDGVGFASPTPLQRARGHLGLTSMRERAEMAGGWCRLSSLPGQGTTVEFWVPGRAPRREDRPVELDEEDQDSPESAPGKTSTAFVTVR